jgi:hypothetical protein
LFELDIDIFILNETWLSSEIPDNLITKNYKLFRHDRFDRGEGVLTVIKSCYKCIELSFFNDEFEDLWVEVIKNNKNLLIGTLYLPPNIFSNEKIYTFIKSTLNKITYCKSYEMIVFTGDLNIKCINEFNPFVSNNYLIFMV